jgi:hypothetical protein
MILEQVTVEVTLVVEVTVALTQEAPQQIYPRPNFDVQYALGF